jgi:hypothetical protein
MIAQPTGLAGLDRVDGQRPSVDTPPGRGAQVLVVVAQVPHHVVDIGHRPAAAPMMGDTRDPAQRVPGFGSRGVHLAHDGVLGAGDRGQGGQRRAHPAVTVFGAGRRQLVRR